MRSSILARAGAAVAGGLLALGLAAPAMANTEININKGNVPTTAAGFKNHDCDPNFGGGPFPGMDVWVFNLPGNHNTTGDFVAVTATFDTGNGIVEKVIPDDGGAIVLKGTSKAWIALPAGWTLTGATAEITGEADFFVLTHTCPAGSPSPSGTSSGKPSGPPNTGGGGSTSTGGFMLGTGALLLAGTAGIGLVLVARRRRGLA
jgi:hypothetical protein